MSFVSRMSILNNKIVVLADTFRSKETELRVLNADEVTLNNFYFAHSILTKASTHWQAAKTAVIAGDAKTAEAELTNATAATELAQRALKAIGKGSEPADQSDAAQEPAVSLVKPPQPQPAPSPPKKDDVKAPAKADEAEEKGRPTKASIDLQSDEFKKAVQVIAHEMFGEHIALLLEHDANLKPVRRLLGHIDTLRRPTKRDASDGGNSTTPPTKAQAIVGNHEAKPKERN